MTGDRCMQVLNVHQLVLQVPATRAASLIDGLASAGDMLWPADRWPPMRFDRPLGVGATGGHGPIRYTVESYVPGQRVVFRFLEPRGFVGTHRFEIEPLDAASARLRHVIEMQAKGRAWLAWTLAIRPLHDALLEDAMDRAARFTGQPLPWRRWSCRVRFIRWIMRRRRSRADA